MPNLNRREFIKSLSAAGLLMTAPRLVQSAVPAGFANNNGKRILLNIILDGGPDIRHLLPPEASGNQESFAGVYWKHRATAHAIKPDDLAAVQDRWDQDFFHQNANGVNFGILNQAGWLNKMWEQGSVALVNNAIGSGKRDHAQALLALEQGDSNTGSHDLDKSGWGGRLAASLGKRVVSLTHQPRRFCYGPHATNERSHDNSNLLAMRNSRNYGLFTPNPKADPASSQVVIDRALKSYYAAKRLTMPASSPYHKFLQHEKNLRFFGDALRERLASIPIPLAIESLYDEKVSLQTGIPILNKPYLGRQIRNMYDCLAANDIIDFQVACMEYGGWDTHKNQKRFIEQKLSDLFGENRALDILYQSLPADITDNLIITISGEFGRQLKSNGDNGTDHGRGNTILVIGKGIKGGSYGELFPNDELDKIASLSPDIVGKTNIEHVFAAACDYVEPGISSQIFPTRDTAMLEAGVNPNLFV